MGRWRKKGNKKMTPVASPAILDSDDEVEDEAPPQLGFYTNPVAAREIVTNLPSEISTSFYEQFGPVKHLFDSYNYFMSTMLPDIFSRVGYFEHEERGADNTVIKLHSVKILSVAIDGEDSNIVIDEADGNLRVLYPFEARMRGLTYARKLFAEFEHTVYSVDSIGGKKILIRGRGSVNVGEIPIMVKSEYCSLFGLSDEELAKAREDPMDPGGYFIIKGKEKVLISQERPAHNQIFIFKAMCDADYQLQAELRSSTHPAAEDVCALWIRIPGKPITSEKGSQAEAQKSSNVGEFFTPSNSKLITFNKKINICKQGPLLRRTFEKTFPGLIVNHATLRDPVPLLVLYKALGFSSNEKVWNTLAVTNDLEVAFRDNLKTTFENRTARSLKNKRDALIYLGKLTKVQTSEVKNRETGARRTFSDEDYFVKGLYFVNNEVLPHIGTTELCNDIKAFHVGYMVNRLVQASLGYIPCDDRDHLQNKRFDLAGSLLTSLTKRLVARMMEEMRQRVARKVDSKYKYHFFNQIAGTALLTQGFQYAFTSGNWGDQRFSASALTGVSQSLNRITPIATLSFLRRVNAPLYKLSRMVAPRKVHNTGFGYICPVDTPEGEGVGLLKTLALMTQVSIEADASPILTYLKNLDYTPLKQIIETNSNHLSTETKIFINATLVGTYPSSNLHTLKMFVDKLKAYRIPWDENKFSEFKTKSYELATKRMKREAQLGQELGQSHKTSEEDEEAELMDALDYVEMFSNQISITHDYERKEIRIRTDGGRLLRPLFVVENNALKITQGQIKRLLDKDDKDFGWNDLIKNGVVEFIDPSEEESSYISMFPNELIKSSSDPNDVSFTHCEIDPSAILGVCAALIPYANHNQIPRLSFQSNMAKQSIGIHTLNYQHRYDPESHVLYYPQKPLVTTKSAASFANFQDYPSGTIVIVAICTYTGYNQEDSLIMNLSSIERGLFRSIYYKTAEDYSDQGKSGSEKEIFGKPDPAQMMGKAAFSTRHENLDTDGFPHPGTEMKDGLVLIGKTKDPNLKDTKSQIYKSASSSTSYYNEVNPKKTCQPGRTIVDNVVICDNNEEYRAVKVRLRSVRCPEMGDKFASRHGQKGVMGIALNEVDMPFTKDGIVPDIIINPHAIPSRMTIGHIMEMLDGKLVALTGEISDKPLHATCKDYGDQNMNGINVTEEIGKELLKRGFDSRGSEVLYNGYTGRKMNSQCFIGPCFYQRLKHMTEDKIRFRSRGEVSTLEKQPNRGRTQGGGLRFGEMERDSAISHGGMHFLRERLLLVSDYYKMAVCAKCGQPLLKRRDPRPSNSAAIATYLKCTFCKTHKDRGVMLELPYAAKLLFQELMCMNIRVALMSNDKNPNNFVQELPPTDAEINSRSQNANVSVVDRTLETSESKNHLKPLEEAHNSLKISSRSTEDEFSNFLDLFSKT